MKSCSQAIANYFLDLAKEEEKELTPLPCSPLLVARNNVISDDLTKEYFKIFLKVVREKTKENAKRD